MKPTDTTEKRKECPLCGERMRLKEYEQVSLIPGTGETKKRMVNEWVCPECDYFEEYDEESGLD